MSDMEIQKTKVSADQRMLSVEYKYEENQPMQHWHFDGVRIPWEDVKSNIPPNVSVWYKTKLWFKWLFKRYTIENQIADILANEIRHEIDKEIMESIRSLPTDKRDNRENI